jgi:hypothetical protein
MLATPVAAIFQSLTRREKEKIYETRSKTLHHHRGQPHDCH